MLNGAIRGQINKLRDALWSGGVSNPLTGVEQLTYLLFIRRLDEHLFPSLALARRIIEAWRTDYNTVRPHSSLGGLAPAAFTNRPRQGQRNNGANLSAA